MYWPLLFLAIGAVVALRPPLGQSIVVLVVDGYGAALLNSSKTENMAGINAMISNGVKAEALIPTFPSLTVPSWHSFATGLYTENHGFNSNYMYDAETGNKYEGGYSVNDSNYFWWKDTPKPFWYTAGKAGVDIHCYWFSYCQQSFGDMAVIIPEERKTNLLEPEQTEELPQIFPEMVTRIRRYQPYRKQIFLLRYAGIDTALRTFGPGTEAVENAVQKFDSYLQDLQEKMEQEKLFTSTNLIVLSEHGLARVVEEEVFYLEECLSEYANVRMVVSSPSIVQIFTDKDAEDGVFFELKVCDQWVSQGDYEDSVNSVEVFRSNTIPEKYHLANARFLGNIVIITKPGTTVVTRELPSVPARDFERPKNLMEDGWEPEAESMKGIFLARGPAFHVNQQFGPIELVDIYQVLLNIVGLEPAHPTNGSWDRIEKMMTEDWADRTSPSTSTAAQTTTLLLGFALIVARLL